VLNGNDSQRTIHANSLESSYIVPHSGHHKDMISDF